MAFEDEGVDLRLVVGLGVAAGRSRVGADSQLDPEQQRRGGLRIGGRAESRDPLGRLVHRHPRVVHRTVTSSAGRSPPGGLSYGE